MSDANDRKAWERTNVSNLLRNGTSGIYYARVKVRGKEKWRSLRTTLFSVAKLRLSDFEKEVRGRVGGIGGVSSPDDAKVGRFIDAYLGAVGQDTARRESTRHRIEIAVKALVKTWPDLRDRDVRKLTPEDCREWAVRANREGTGFVAPLAKTKRRGMAASSFNKALDALRGILGRAVEQGVIYRNPAAEVDKRVVGKKQLQLPSGAQFAAIVASVRAAGARQSKDCGDMVELLAYSGARLEEGVALRWVDFDLGKNKVTINGTKTATSRRTVPIIPPLRALVERMRAERPDEPLATPVLRVNECKGALASACKAVGVKRLTHHDLRHLFATRCIEAGVDIPTISKWLGHADGGALAMSTYGHLRQDHSDQQAAKVTF